jgi:hypothetical protein
MLFLYGLYSLPSSVVTRLEVDELISITSVPRQFKVEDEEIRHCVIQRRRSISVQPTKTEFSSQQSVVLE